MTNYSLNLIWSDEDEAYIATCPEFPGLSAFGATPEEALTEAKVALAGFIQMYEDEGLPLPKAEKVEEYSGQFRVRLPKALHRQVAALAKRNRISLNQFVIDAVAERVGARRFCDEMIKEVKQLIGDFQWQNLSLASRLMKWETEPIRIEEIERTVTTERSTQTTVYGGTNPRRKIV